MKALLMSLVSVVALVTTGPAFADRCSADASVNYHSMYKNKYIFQASVHSNDCTKYSCSGFVHFGIRYHYAGDSDSVVDNTLVDYLIHNGEKTRQVSMEHWVGNVDANVQIDSVDVGEVTCTSP